MRWSEIPQRRRILAGATLVIATTAAHALLLWLSRGSSPVVPGVDPVANARAVLANPVAFLLATARVPFAFWFGEKWNVYESMIGKLGWLDAPLGWVTYAILTLMIAAAPFAAGRSVPRHDMRWLLGLAFASVLMIALPLRLFASTLDATVVFGLQGRYFIPTLALTLVALSSALEGRFVGAARVIVVLASFEGAAAGALAITNRYYA